MSEPFLGEIRMVGFNFAPRGWAFCNGQSLPIKQNQALYYLLGTTYGGDGRTVFSLPDLRGRTPLHTGATGFGPFHYLGSKGGEETHTLGVDEIPSHQHNIHASNMDGETTNASNNVLAREVGNPYATPTQTAELINMNPAIVTNTGGNQSHNNMQPFLVVNFCIALQGIPPVHNEGTI
jgi:microcystin-dependent protein